MSLDRLADIEVQLCMHGMMTLERLQFARCSRQLMHAAQSPFAWKHAPPLVIDFPTRKSAAASDDDIRSDGRHHSMLRHCALFVHLQPIDTGRWSVCHPLVTDLIALASSSVQPIHTLDAGNVILDLRQWLRLLACPPLQTHLRSIRFHNWSNFVEGGVKLFRALAALPSLSTLRMDMSWVGHEEGPAAGAELVHLRSLTSLRFRDGGQQGWTSQLDNVAAIPGLKRLHVHSPSLYGGAFKQFCCSFDRIMHQLEVLKLDYFACGGARVAERVTAEDYAAGFASLRALRCLHLIRVFSVDVMIAHVHHIPNLRTLDIQPNAETWRFFVHGTQSNNAERSMPSVRSIAQVLTRAPQIKCAVRLFARKKPREEEIAAALQMMPRLRDAPELTPFGHRFEVRMTGSWPTAEQQARQEVERTTRAYFVPPDEPGPKVPPPTPPRPDCSVQ
jgi:hypothetical protein